MTKLYTELLVFNEAATESHLTRTRMNASYFMTVSFDVMVYSVATLLRVAIFEN